MHQAGEFKRFIGGNRVAVHHMQRISGLPHVQPRQRPPGAADRVESTVLAAFEHRQSAERFLDEFFRLLDRFCRNVGQGETAERPGQAAPRARAVDIDELERAAAEIADHAVRLMHAGDHAERGQFRLARARKDVDLGSHDAFGKLDKGAAVLGVTTGGGGDRQNFLHAHGRAQRPVALERGQCLLDRISGEQSGRLHLAAEPAQRLLVEQRRRTAGEAFVDHEPHRIGADVDDAKRRTIVETSGCVDLGAAHWSQSVRGKACSASPCAHARSERCRNRGTESLGDFPRPDRLGLVMK